MLSKATNKRLVSAGMQNTRQFSPACTRKNKHHAMAWNNFLVQSCARLLTLIATGLACRVQAFPVMLLYVFAPIVLSCHGISAE